MYSSVLEKKKQKKREKEKEKKNRIIKLYKIEISIMSLLQGTYFPREKKRVKEVTLKGTTF